MKNTSSKRLLSLVTAFVVALTFMAVWSGAANAIPQMQFRNEKVAGLTVTKEIYRKASSTLPLRSGIEDDKKFYNANKLGEDEFRLYLLEGKSADDIAPRAGESYTRSNKYGYYLSCPNFSAVGADLIIRPLNSGGGYEVYYYDADGVRQIYDMEHTSTAETLGARFREDYSTGVTPTKNFSTGKNGEFYIFDGSEGDQVYFKKLKSNYYYITEDTELLSVYNANKISDRLTGVYDNKITALQTGLGVKYDAADANMFEVRNQFDVPNDAFTIRKTVNYFGDKYIFDEEFTFELLVDGVSPAGYRYEKYEGEKLIDEGTFPFGDEPAVIKLKSNQHIDIKGIMKNTPIEVRELITDVEGNKLNPSFSPLTVQSLDDGKSYTLVAEELPSRKRYVSWEGLYESNKVDTADFINVPNVMMVRKNVVNPLAVDDITEYDFEFEIKKYNGTGYVELADNKQLKYYLRDNYGDIYGDPDKNGAPFITQKGKFTLKHGQTAIFIGLTEGEKFSVNETRALQDGRNVSIDFVMDDTIYYKTARAETVKTAYTQLSSGEIFIAKNTYDKKLGLKVTKTVNDDYKRADPDAEYSFILQTGTQVGSNWDFEDTVSDGKVKLNGDTIPADERVVFTLKDGETANITGLAKGIYRVVESDPNAVANIYGKVEEHLFITDVQVNGGDVSTFNPVKSNGDTADSTEDAISDQFILSKTGSVDVEFTNKVRELRYYFDIEKIAFLDKNIHGDSGDQEQRFIFKVERFAEDETEFTSENALESFYVDMSCDKEMVYYSEDDVTLDGESYKYAFWHEADTISDTHSSFETSGGTKVRKTYDDDTYTYPSSIWNGRKTIMVTKSGKYRVTEIENLSETDYDYWKSSNRYKGYNDAEGGTRDDNSVIIDVSKVKADKFSSESAMIDTVTVYRPTASFISSESEFAYFSSQSYSENTIKRK